MTSFAPSVRVGIQTPRILHVSSAPRVHSVGREAVELAASAGLVLDPWQELILDHALSVRPDGKWCASDVGVMVSRQNGKGSILEALELWALFINEETILHTAHNYKTALEGFRRIEQLIRGCPELAADVLRISHNNNDQVIELRNGARLMFGTRTKGAARGLTLDRVICDEAMYLTEEHVMALNPTTMATPNPQTWLLGSAGTKESTEFGRMRQRAITGGDPSLAYFEWSSNPHNAFCYKDCDDHDDPGAVETFAKANPALGDRIAVDYMESRFRGMSLEAFQQEHLGVGDWPLDGEGWLVIGKDSWTARVDETSQIQGKLVIGVDTDPESDWSCVSVCGLNERDKYHVEITASEEAYHHQPGIQWVVPTVIALWKSHKPLAVVIMKDGNAGGFIPELEKAGVRVISPNSAEYAQSCSSFKNAVVPRRGEEAKLSHIDQPPLNAAVGGADVRELTNMWAWSKRASSVDISPLVSATLAFWGFKQETTKGRGFAMVAFR